MATPLDKQRAFHDAAAKEASNSVTTAAARIGSITYDDQPQAGLFGLNSKFLSGQILMSEWLMWLLSATLHLLQQQKLEDIWQSPSFQGLIIHWPGGKQGRQSMKS